MADDLNGPGPVPVGVHPAGDHVEVGVYAVEPDEALAFIFPVADGDSAEMVTDEGGHGHASSTGLFLEGGPFLIGEADPEHVGTGFLAHVFSIVLLGAYMKTRLPDIATQIGPWSGGLAP